MNSPKDIRRLNTRDALVLLIVGAVIASIMVGTGIAITSPDFTYDRPRVGALSIHAMDLAPESDTNEWNIDFDEGQLRGDGCFSTGVHLPQGAKIKSVRAYSDSLSYSNLHVFLSRSELATGQGERLVFAEVVDDSNERISTTLAVPARLAVVDNKVYSYGFAACVGLGTAFKGARINYEYTTAGD